MISKRAILEGLSKSRLLELAGGLGLDGACGSRKGDLVGMLVRKRSFGLPELLGRLRVQELKAACRGAGLEDSPRRKGDLAALLLGATGDGRADSGNPEAGPGAGSRGGAGGKADEGGVGTMAKKRKKTESGKRPIEQYDHKDKRRANNPPVGLVTPQTDPDQPRKTYQYDPHLDPQLVWAGKGEHTSFDVPTVSLHVHERIDPRTIIKAVRKRNGERKPGLRQLSLFEQPEANPPLREAIEFYKHPHGWTNRLIAGDSLVVMNSLLEKEGMAGKVQMVFIDPPYGIRYRSNFQPFVRQSDVSEGDKDTDLTQEPEMIHAFRDTWQLGTHSYLTYLRDRVLLCRDLLTETGSVFVQISTENLNLVTLILDEVFGAANRIELISFRKKTMPLGGRLLEGNCDYLAWYARHKEHVKYYPLFRDSNVEGDSHWNFVELPTGERRQMTREEIDNHKLLPPGSDVYQLIGLYPTGAFDTGIYDFAFDGKTYQLPPGKSWKTPIEGMERLAFARRLQPYASGSTLRYVLKHSDYPITPMDNVWSDTSAPSDKVYVVQTSRVVSQRCMLMTTDPGDLVFDPTCGSGTTAVVAEHWGRRWITCDTSRVAVALAKQRLMTRFFSYFCLIDECKGVAGDFKYRTSPHITLRSIANNPSLHKGMSAEKVDQAIALFAEKEIRRDQPIPDRSKVRVTGPFTIEAVPAPAVRPISEITMEPRPAPIDEQGNLPGIANLDGQTRLEFTEDASVARYGETARQRQWRDELLACGVRGKGGQRIEFARVEPLGATRWLHCEGETKGERVERAVVSFGPEHAPLEQRQVELALEEAVSLKPTPNMVLFAAFQFDPEAAKDIDVTNWPGVTLLKVQMNTDLLTDDLKKKRSSNESYWLMGQPDVALRKIQRGEGKGLWEVEVHGFDYYNPRTGAIESGDTTKIAMWMLDTDYDGRSLYPQQVFFPMAGEKDGWARLAKNLKAEIDEDLIEAYRGTVSLPFEAGDYGRVAVKIVDDRGIESLRIVGFS